MCTRNSLPIGILACVLSGATHAGELPGLGRPLSEAEVAAADYTVMPDGEGLPAGRGNARRGADVYRQHCLACHGEEGTGGVNDGLTGGHGSLTTGQPVKTIGSYWPYLTTVSDYVRRAMPYQTPGVLSNDDIYSVTAYLLFLNGIVEEDAETDADSLPRVRMPNRDNFEWDFTPTEQPGDP